MTMASDLASRDPRIDWPSGFAPEAADLFAHNEIRIHAPRAAIWTRIIQAVRWPEWFANAESVTLPGRQTQLAHGTAFQWTTFGMAIDSRVYKVASEQALGWFGLAGGQPAFAIEWLLSQEDGECVVVLEEAGIGEVASRFRASDEGALHRAHEVWLTSLKALTEAG